MIIPINTEVPASACTDNAEGMSTRARSKTTKAIPHQLMVVICQAKRMTFFIYRFSRNNSTDFSRNSGITNNRSPIMECAIPTAKSKNAALINKMFIIKRSPKAYGYNFLIEYEKGSIEVLECCKVKLL